MTTPYNTVSPLSRRSAAGNVALCDSPNFGLGGDYADYQLDIIITTIQQGHLVSIPCKYQREVNDIGSPCCVITI